MRSVLMVQGVVSGLLSKAVTYGKSAKGYMRWVRRDTLQGRDLYLTVVPRSSQAFKYGIVVGWWVATTTVVTLLPLMLEVRCTRSEDCVQGL
jgi:hypothetical protein